MSTHPALGDVGERSTETVVWIDAQGAEQRIVVGPDDVLEFTEGWLHMRGPDAVVSWPAYRVHAVETREQK